MNRIRSLLPQVCQVQDIPLFLGIIASETDDFHPLKDFTLYTVENSHFRLYSQEEAEARNDILEACFQLCQTAKLDPNILLNWYNSQRNELDCCQAYREQEQRMII